MVTIARELLEATRFGKNAYVEKVYKRIRLVFAQASSKSHSTSFEDHGDALLLSGYDHTMSRFESKTLTHSFFG